MTDIRRNRTGWSGETSICIPHHRPDPADRRPARFAKCIRKRGSWKDIDEVEYATLEWVDWFNNRRLLEPNGNIPPTEYEIMYYRQLEEPSEAA